MRVWAVATTGSTLRAGGTILPLCTPQTPKAPTFSVQYAVGPQMGGLLLWILLRISPRALQGLGSG